MINAELLLNGEAVQGSAADNATASATKAAAIGVRHFLAGIRADYSAAVAAIKTVTVKLGTTVVQVYRWDFSKGPFADNMPVPIKPIENTALTVELEASGTVGVTGRVTMFVASR